MTCINEHTISMIAEELGPCLEASFKRSQPSLLSMICSCVVGLYSKPHLKHGSVALQKLTSPVALDYSCEVAGIPAAEFERSMRKGGRKPIFTGVAFFVSCPQLVGLMLRGFMPAAFLFSRGRSTWHQARLFCLNAESVSTSNEKRGAAMRAQLHFILAQSALKTHTNNLIDCIDDLDAVKHRIELLLRDYKDDGAAYFTLLSIQNEIERVNTQLHSEVAA